MQMSATPGPNQTVVAVSGELDIASTPGLRQMLHQHLDAGATALIVDLTDVAFLDSTALSVFVSVHKRLAELGSGLTLVSPHERLQRIFRMTALDRVFTIVATRPDTAAGPPPHAS